MSVHELRPDSCAKSSQAAAHDYRASGAPRRQSVVQRWLPTALVAIVLLLLPALPARAQQQQYVPCPAAQQTLVKIPELVTENGKLRGTIVLSDEQERIATRQPSNTLPGDPGTVTKCVPQYVRTLRGVNAVPAPPPPASPYPDPLPGPTLRARVGDLIQLTFINEINPGHFGRSIDNGETGVGCDQTPGIYPQGGGINDHFPDCFHGSSTGNIHFHGTHTNPNSTGDNVFIEVRPLPRDNAGKLTTGPEKVQQSLDQFFAQCETQLKPNVLREWPKLWGDLPANWTEQQKNLLQAYDKQLTALYGVPPAKALWPVDAKQLLLGQWPQYYIGAYPYCFRLPEYTKKTWAWPTPGQTPMQMGGMGMHTGGAGTAELSSMGAEEGDVSPELIMGQSPGTHWYHAHKHGSTAINVANGMTGAFIIEGPSYDDDINAWYGTGWTRTQPVMVINQIGVSPNLLRGSAGRTDKGPDFSVNGQLQPVVQMRAGEVQMWRIVNSSGRAGTLFVAPHKDAKTGKPDQYEWRQLAQDGVQFDNVNYQQHHNKSFLLAAGNRADLLVKALPCADTTKSCTYPVIVQNEVDPTDLAQANMLTLAYIKVMPGPPLDPVAPAANFMPNAPQPFPPFLADITKEEVKGRKRTITFSSTGPGKGGVHMIDGKQFDGEVGVLVRLDTVEEWKVVNETYGPLISHPFHIHINPFQVIEVFSPNDTLTVPDPKQPGKTITVPQYIFDPKAQVSKQQCLLNPLADPDDWKPCGPPPVNKDGIWWDVFPIPSGTKATDAQNNPIINPNTKQPVLVPGYFKMRSRFVDYSGYYVIHCHILAHEDRGMMTVVEVAPSRPPFSHH